MFVLRDPDNLLIFVVSKLITYILIKYVIGGQVSNSSKLNCKLFRFARFAFKARRWVPPLDTESVKKSFWTLAYPAICLIFESGTGSVQCLGNQYFNFAQDVLVYLFFIPNL